MVEKQHETQEQSIKARKHQLFDADEPTAAAGSGRPFAEFLKTTPAAPLSGPTKAGLWAAGAVVVLVLVAALLRTLQHQPKPRPAARPAGKSARALEPSGRLAVARRLEGLRAVH